MYVSAYIIDLDVRESLGCLVDLHLKTAQIGFVVQSGVTQRRIHKCRVLYLGSFPPCDLLLKKGFDFIRKSLLIFCLFQPVLRQWPGIGLSTS